LAAASGLYGAALALVAAANAAGPEQWWPATLNLYLPQWLWLLPALVLFFAALRIARRLAWLPLAGAAWVLGPGMGICLPLGAARGEATGRLRVMTYNTRGASDVAGVVREIGRARPDLLLMQEADVTSLEKALDVLGLQIVGSAHSVALAVRDAEVIESDARPLPFSAEWRKYLRARLKLGGRELTVYNLHLDTPREGFDELRKGRLGGIAAVRAEADARVNRALRLASDAQEEPGPLIVGGDLNAPRQSMVCGAFLRLGLQDAFGTAGYGYGYTYGHRLKVGLGGSFVRIDHLLVGRDWGIQRCWTGGAKASDHRPVIADLVPR
jgi:endonuclease/exonuclease/phosphatase (EEP) superfamily protein YafD